jgi:hypothetical protein
VQKEDRPRSHRQHVQEPVEAVEFGFGGHGHCSRRGHASQATGGRRGANQAPRKSAGRTRRAAMQWRTWAQPRLRRAAAGLAVATAHLLSVSRS